MRCFFQKKVKSTNKNAGSRPTNQIFPFLVKAYTNLWACQYHIICSFTSKFDSINFGPTNTINHRTIIYTFCWMVLIVACKKDWLYGLHNSKIANKTPTVSPFCVKQIAEPFEMAWKKDHHEECSHFSYVYIRFFLLFFFSIYICRCAIN